MAIPKRRRQSTRCSDSIYGTTPNTLRILSRGSSFIDDTPEPEIGFDDVKPVAVNIEETHNENVEDNDDTGRLIEEEAAMTGRVKWGVYYDYAKSIGLVGAVTGKVIFLFYPH